MENFHDTEFFLKRGISQYEKLLWLFMFST